MSKGTLHATALKELKQLELTFEKSQELIKKYRGYESTLEVSET